MMIVDEVLSKDERIRFAALFDEELQVKEMKMKEEIESLTPEYIDKVVIPLLIGLIGRIEQYVGKLDTAGIEYEKVKLFIRRRVDGFLIVSAEKDITFSELDELLK